MTDWISAHPALAQFYSAAVASVLGLAALIIASVTAWSTNRTVKEMREARLQSIRPVLHLTPNTSLWRLDWSPSKTPYPALTFGTDKQKISGPFTLFNTTASAAFEIQCKWSLSEAASLPDDFRSATIGSAAQRHNDVVKYEKGKILLTDKENDGFGDWDIEYALTADSRHGVLVGHSEQSVGIPRLIENQILLIAINYIEQRQIYDSENSAPKFKLTLLITCSSPSGESIVRRQSMDVQVGGWAAMKNADGKYIDRGSLPTDWSSAEVSLYVTSVSIQPPLPYRGEADVALTTALSYAARVLARAARQALPF